jgi:hypothetical protein
MAAAAAGHGAGLSADVGWSAERSEKYPKSPDYVRDLGYLGVAGCEIDIYAPALYHVESLTKDYWRSGGWRTRKGLCEHSVRRGRGLSFSPILSVSDSYYTLNSLDHDDCPITPGRGSSFPSSPEGPNRAPGCARLPGGHRRHPHSLALTLPSLSPPS